MNLNDEIYGTANLKILNQLGFNDLFLNHEFKDIGYPTNFYFVSIKLGRKLLHECEEIVWTCHNGFIWAYFNDRNIDKLREEN